MTDDQPARFAAQNFRGAPGRVLVADAMKSIAADALRKPVIRTGINVGLGLQRGMERRVEDGDLRNARENARGRIDRLQLEFVMRRSDFGFGRDGFADFGGDALRQSEHVSSDREARRHPQADH